MGSKILKMFSPIAMLADAGSDNKSSSNNAAQNVEANKRKAKKSRSALFSTEGGVNGQEVGSVNNRKSLLGN